MMDCDHVRRWTERVEKYNEWTGETEIEYVEREESTCQDISLHRYRCTKCGGEFFYSGAAARGEIPDEPLKS